MENGCAGGIALAIRTFSVEHSRATQVRIDYVQHTLSAMIQHKELFYSEAGELSHDGA